MTDDSTSLPSDLETALRSARRVTVLTGAGISADSGVPTFRDAQTGHWARFDPQQLASPEAFRQDPNTVWQWYVWRRQELARCAPNAGHRALAEWAESLERCTVATQNVDGLHQAAGSGEVLELHGSLARDCCMDCDHTSIPGYQRDAPPQCPACGGLMRPAVVWFGEALPMDALHGALAAVAESDLVLSVGTSSLVQPAASIPVEALERTIPVLEINPESTPLTPHATWSLRQRGAEALPDIVACATG